MFLRTAAAGAALLHVHPLRSRAAAGSLKDDEVLAQAASRIEKHRKGAGAVVVRAPNGQPVAGARVKVEQQRHQFLFGCNFFRFGHVGNPDREEEYRRRFAALFNFATLGFYWPSYEPERGQPIYDYTDRVLDWASRNGVTCKGHPLVWDFADPRWLPRDLAEIATLSHARVREIVARFKGRLDIWDVVNEPTHLGRFGTRMGEWAQSLGAVPYVRAHLKIARQANPRATLLVNDYRTDPPFSSILEGLTDNGQPLYDVIGIQSHMHGGVWPLANVWEVCDRFGRLGRPIHFTETTILSGPKLADTQPRPASQRRSIWDHPQWSETTPEGEAKQAEATARFYTALFAHPSVQAVTWWDFSDDGAWQRAAAGWVRKDMSPKPVYDRMLELVKGRWWTRFEGVTNAGGELALSAFYGAHRITVERTGQPPVTKEVQWKRGQSNRFELTV